MDAIVHPPLLANNITILVHTIRPPHDMKNGTGSNREIIASGIENKVNIARL
jgi:hypothetical protein